MPPPLYAARIKDLIDGRVVSVVCVHCGHAGLVPVGSIKQRLLRCIFVTELDRRFRCTCCGRKGQVDVKAMRALGWTGRSPRPD